jgi:hypothetical protein
MTSTMTTTAIAAATIVLYASVFATDVQSQSRRGDGGGRTGGGFSRVGPAEGGSFAAGRPAAPQPSGQRAGSRQGAGAARSAQEPSGERQQAASERQTQRQQGTTERQQASSERQTQRQQGQSQREQSTAARQQDRQQYGSETQQKRQEYGGEVQENRQDYANEAREDWQDYDEDWDNRGTVAAGAAVAAGAYAVGRATATPSTTYVVQAPCSPMSEVNANGITYYGCGSSWYTRSYAGGGIVYSTAAPPPGY